MTTRPHFLRGHADFGNTVPDVHLEQRMHYMNQTHRAVPMDDLDADEGMFYVPPPAWVSFLLDFAARWQHTLLYVVCGAIGACLTVAAWSGRLPGGGQ